jgi:hypothetical protein
MSNSVAADQRQLRRNRGQEASANKKPKAVADHLPFIIRAQNPKKRSSACWQRYELYKRATTLAEYLHLGGSRADFRYDLRHGFITGKGVGELLSKLAVVGNPRKRKRATAAAEMELEQHRQQDEEEDGKVYVRLVAENNGTVQELAQLHHFDPQQLLEWNRAIHSGLTLTARLVKGTELVTWIETEDSEGKEEEEEEEAEEEEEEEEQDEEEQEEEEEEEAEANRAAWWHRFASRGWWVVASADSDASSQSPPATSSSNANQTSQSPAGPGKLACLCVRRGTCFEDCPTSHVWYVRPHVPQTADLAQLSHSVDYFETQAEVEAFAAARNLVGHLVRRRCCRGGGCRGGSRRSGGGSGGGSSSGGSKGGGGCGSSTRSGVVVAAAAVCRRGRAQFTVQFQDGTAEVLSRRTVLRIIDDTRGPCAEECSVCYGCYGDQHHERGQGEEQERPAEVEVAVPMMLACGHTFCTGCVAYMHANEQADAGASARTRSGRGASIVCPHCRAPYKAAAPLSTRVR